MMNEVKIDHTKPVWVNVWNGNGGKYKRIYLFTWQDRHYCVDQHYNEIFLRGEKVAHSEWEFIEFPKEKKRITFDAKSCPRRPVLSHPAWGEGVEFYPDICEKGLHADVPYTWEILMNGDYKINGLPASREVGE